MAIAYNPTNNRIEVNESTLAYLSTINTAAIDGGFTDKFYRVGTSGAYYAKCPIYFSDAANCYFGVQSREVLIFEYSTADNTAFPQTYMLLFNSTGACRLGSHDPTNYNNQRTLAINMVAVLSTACRYWLGGDVIIANSYFAWVYYAYIYGTETQQAYIYKSMFFHTQFGISPNKYCDIEDVTCYGGYYGMQPAEGLGAVNGLTIKDNNIGMILSSSHSTVGYVATLRNVKMARTLTGVYTYLRINSFDRNAYFIDCDIPKEGLGWYGSSTKTGAHYFYQHMQTTTTFIITDIDGNPFEGVTIKVYDKDDNLMHTKTTDINGEAEETMTYHLAYRAVIDTVVQDPVRTDYEPFSIVISKEGYQDLTLEDISVVAGVPTIIRGALKLPKYYSRAKIVN